MEPRPAGPDEPAGHAPLSRRVFLERAGTAMAGVFIAPHVLSEQMVAHAHGHPSNAVATVGITQATAYDRAAIKARVQHLFESIGGIGDVVKGGDKVAIKINLTGGSGNAGNPKLGGRPITESMWTHPEVLRAVGELLIDAGVAGNDITIVEALWDTASFNNFGYLAVQQSLGAQLVNLNNAAPYPAFVQRSVGPNRCYYDAFSVNQILSDVNVYVSIPKLKDHYEAGLTASLKNQVGMVPKSLYTMTGDTGRRGELHGGGGEPSPTHLPKSVCDLNLARPVHLAVIDGVLNARGGEGVWNPTFVIAQDHLLLAGKDPVATDSVSGYLIGHNPGSATLNLPAGGTCDNHLALLAARGAGTNQMSQIQAVGDGAGLVTSVGPEPQRAHPDRVELYQNFPNPFNPSTMFSFHLPEAASAAVAVYGITGERIETLLEGWLPAGVHSFRWAPSGLASGVYFCELRAGGIVDRKKMIYQK